MEKRLLPTGVQRAHMEKRLLLRGAQRAHTHIDARAYETIERLNDGLGDPWAR